METILAALVLAVAALAAGFGYLLCKVNPLSIRTDAMAERLDELDEEMDDFASTADMHTNDILRLAEECDVDLYAEKPAPAEAQACNKAAKCCGGRDIS